MTEIETSTKSGALTSEALVSKHELASNQVDLVAQKLKACGEGLRVQALQCLRSDAFGVLELTQIFDTKQSGMSHHLKVLSKAGLVEAQREGNSIFYRRPVQRQRGLEFLVVTQLFAILDALPVHPDIERRMRVIREQRAIQSQAFFNKNSDLFSAQQELICNHEQYAQTSFDLLKAGLADARSRVLEIGPGEGNFLKLLGSYYKDVVAVDTSEQMLAKADKLCTNNDIRNVQLMLGEATALADQDERFDGIVMNMVLHHIPAPARIFNDCARLLSKGGVLVICDLSHHDQEWTKENCGDAWLGFETAELTTWAEAANFHEDESVFIGLRNGFQIQLHRYIKQ